LRSGRAEDERDDAAREHGRNVQKGALSSGAAADHSLREGGGGGDGGGGDGSRRDALT